MANAKFIDAATWASLPEIDVTNGEDLFPQLAAGTYRPVLSGVDSAVIPALTAGAIVQSTPTVGDTLTVSGSNATSSATFQWQRDTGGGQANISGATSATYDTTGQPEGDYRRGVSDGVQGPVYTAAVTLDAAATVPATMSAPTVTAVSDTEISVDRAAAPSDGGSAILSYDLRWEVDGSGSWTTVTGITDPQAVTGLTASTLYNVQTRAVNAVGAGAWSASGSATTDAAAGDPVIVQIGDELGAAKRALYDATDWTTMFTGTGGTGAVTADGDQIKYITDLSGGGHHLVAQGDTYAIARAGYIDWNGADFLISGPGSFETAEQHAIIIVFDPQADTSWIAMGSKSSSGIFAGYSEPGGTGVTGDGYGTNVKYSINNETDLTSPNSGALYTAIAAKSGYRSLSIKNLKMSVATPLMISYHTKSAAADFTGRVKYIVHAFNATPTQLSNIHTIWSTA